MNASGNGVGVGVGATVGDGVATVGGGGEIVGDGVGISGFDGFGPGQLVRRQAKIGRNPDPNPKFRRRFGSHERCYLANQAIAVKTMQMQLRAIIGIAGIGFFLPA